jgi:ABC-2 type transport system permease protein
MKTFLAFITKEFIHILRDKRTLLVLLGMPVVQIILFGFTITNEITNANIAVLDRSKDGETQKITNRLLSSNYFRLQSNIYSTEEAESLFRKGKIKMVVVFPENFAKQLERERKAQIEIITDASEPNTASMLNAYTMAIINDYNLEKMQQTGLPIQVGAETQMLYNPQQKGVFMFVPGVITIILMLICTMMTSIAITREKENGTMEILLVSPLKSFMIIIGKVVPYIVLSLLIAFIILLMGVTVFGMPIRGSYLLLFLEITLFIITTLSLGIFISTKTSSQQTAMMISMGGMLLPTILLSGFIFPVESMPAILQWISNVVPAKWFVIIIKSIMIKGIGIAYIWKETLILVGMAVVLIFASIKSFKTRLDI